ncbi:MAG: hypothetical protein ACR2GY_06140 [Phycisphaerales bacterium]
MRRFLLFSALVAIILGALLSSGTAMLCAWTSGRSARIATGFSPAQPKSFGSHPVVAGQQSSFGVQRFAVAVNAYTFSRTPSQQQSQLPAWADVEAIRSSYLHAHEAIGCGWPFIALAATKSFDLATFNPTEEPWKGGWVIERGSVLNPFSSRIIPYSPYWPGVLGNTAIWGAVIFILAVAGRVTRSISRTRGGRCVACGYDLRGNPHGNACPECGTIRSAALAVQ